MHHHHDELQLSDILIPVAFTAFVYLLPAIIAFARRNDRRWQILVGNALLGWTFFVWCYCLILALAPRGPGEE